MNCPTANRGAGPSVGDGVMEDLRGLRSFTITGWLKPDSLQIGSGGNRIVFCLKRDTSGIDLVCHPDGRLRLAVNQWPDRIQNDSSPGKLVVGKWTRFAVTYDSTKTADNVCWYFSRPQDQPGEASLALDRKTTYNVGPVAGDIGPLAIGNFNETMHSYGLDRQFRGQIRSLEIYGSRISGRGALSLDEIGNPFRSRNSETRRRVLSVTLQGLQIRRRWRQFAFSSPASSWFPSIPDPRCVPPVAYMASVRLMQIDDETCRFEGVDGTGSKASGCAPDRRCGHRGRRRRRLLATMAEQYRVRDGDGLKIGLFPAFSAGMFHHMGPWYKHQYLFDDEWLSAPSLR